MAETQDITLASGPLRLVFRRDGDRYGHEIRILDPRADGGERVVLSSVEGDAADACPPSAPFQHLHVEDRTSTAGTAEQVALLVGMAGRGHWSGAIETLPTGGFLFDLACKTSQAPRFLGGTYRFAGPEIEHLRIELISAAEDGTTLTFAEETLSIRAAQAVAGTTRWRYRIGT
ncbi:MAG: hypothetical protein QM811_10840 [Pirellulales bacterium]